MSFPPKGLKRFLPSVRILQTRKNSNGQQEQQQQQQQQQHQQLSTTTSMARTPVYFVSHGGPNIMFDTEHPAHPQLQALGLEITQKVRPKAVVVFSAHWQARGGSRVEVNTAEATDLIYDYHGLPTHYYKVKYPTVGSRAVAEKVLSLLEAAGIKAEGTKRGADHGVFAPFMCMFHPDENPLGVPLVQVSLFGNEDANQHFALGAALQSLRDEGVVIVGSGMAVHNLRDFRRVSMSGGEAPYVKVFDEELRKAVIDPADGEDRKRKLRELLRSKTARQAHPSFEHLLPVHIAAGAAGDDSATRLFTFTELSFSWAQFRFGDVSAA